MKSILFYRKRIFIIFSLIIGTTQLSSAPKINFNAGIDTTLINNKINVLNSHIRYWFSGQYTTYNYTIKQITPSEYQAQKPVDNLSFDAGFVAADGTITFSEPTTAEQKAVFPDLTKVALYYVCQKYLYDFYNTCNLPLLLKVGFPIFEAGLLPADETIKTALTNYGGSLTSFDDMNNATNFIDKKGYLIAGAFGEFMNVYKNWAYQYIYPISATAFNIDSGWFLTGTKAELLADFNRYLSARFLQPDENLRIKVCVETEHFKFYTNQKTVNINFPFFSDVSEKAYTEYVTNFNVQAYEKISFFTLVMCDDTAIEGLECDPNGRLTGGTAWSSGVHSSSSPTSELLHYFNGQNRHEIAHAFQGLMGQGVVTAWLNEGFPSFCDEGPMTDEKLIIDRQQAIDAMNNAIKYFGHRPTYEETRIYPSSDYGYYTMGFYFIDYQYQRGGYPLMKAIQKNDLATYLSMGYASSQAFLDDFYFFFDVKVQGIPVVTLINPKTDNTLTSASVNINWIPLKADTKLNIAVSTDNKNQWTTLATGTTQTSCNWNAGTLTGNFYLKFTAPDNLNLESVFGPFNLTDPTKVSVLSPNGGEYLIAGDTVQLNWSTTTIPNLKIEFSGDNGSSWTLVNSSVSSSSLTYKWLVPWTISNQCKIRVSDAANVSNNDLSDNTFTILRPNQIGGPYLFDKNTVALLHFDNDLKNRSNLSGNGIGSAANIVNDATLSPILGNCYKTNSTVSIPHHANLSLTSDWSIEAWVKMNSFNPSNNMYILTKPGDSDSYASNYSLEINPWWGNVFHSFYFSDALTRVNLISQSFNVKLDEWYHIAMTRNTNNKSIKVYIHDKNRNLLSTSDIPYTPSTTYLNTKDLLIGSGIDGYVDEVRISNVVRSFSSTAVNSPVENKLLTVFPNPSNGLVKMHLQQDAFNSELYITNMAGQIVFREKITNIADFTIDLTSQSKGIYFIHLGGNRKQTLTAKLIIQ